MTIRRRNNRVQLEEKNRELCNHIDLLESKIKLLEMDDCPPDDEPPAENECDICALETEHALICKNISEAQSFLQNCLGSRLIKCKFSVDEKHLDLYNALACMIQLKICEAEYDASCIAYQIAKCKYECNMDDLDTLEELVNSYSDDPNIDPYCVKIINRALNAC